MKKIINFLMLTSIILACSQKKITVETNDPTVNIMADSLSASVTTKEVLYLENVLQCVDFEGLEEKFGAENVIKKAVVESGEGTFETTKLFPNTEKEIEIYWHDGEQYKQIQDVLVKGKLDDNAKLKNSSPWVSRKGLRLGMKMSEVISLNGKNFTISGIGWDLGGNVVSWEGGKLADKNVNIRFNDYSDNMGGLTENDYNSISGDREFDTKHPSIQKLNPVVDELSVYKRFKITPDLGQKMTKEVEKQQIKR